MLAAQPQAMIPGQPAAPTEYIDPMTSALMPPAAPMGRPQYGQPGPSVSTFGGPDASGGRSPAGPALAPHRPGPASARGLHLGLCARGSAPGRGRGGTSG